ncbi:MAG: hypothetical protein V3S98_06225 [Dehalococcoidia bacterium]
MGDVARADEAEFSFSEADLAKLSIDDLRNFRIGRERDYYLSDEGFLDFVRDSGAAPDAEYEPHGRYAQDMITWNGTPDPDLPSRVLYRWKLALWPRGSFKSQVFNVGMVAWMIARDPNIRILVCSETDRQAKKFVQESMKIVESEWFAERFGIRKGKSWKIGTGSFEDAQRTRRGIKDPTLQASGVGAVQTGSHWDFVLIDDMCSQENTRTQESIESLWHWFGETIAQLDPGCKLFIVGTLHHYNDIYCRIMKEPKIRAKFDVSQFGWCSQYGVDPELPLPAGVTVFFPGRLTRTYVAEQKAILPPRLFACFYENRPTTDEQQMFRREYFKLIPESNIPRGCWGYILTDFAFISDEKKKDKADQTCFWVVLLDANRVAYVVDFVLGRWKPSDSVRLMCDLWDKWSQRVEMKGISLEKTAAYNELIQSLLEEVRRDTMVRPKMILIGGRSQDQKDMRIESVEPRFRRGDIFFAASLEADYYDTKWNPLITEMMEWPFSAHDDVPDAISDLDKRDQEDRLYMPGPPPGWMPQMYGRQTPDTINGQYNPDTNWDPRTKIRAEDINRGKDEIWRKSTSPASNEIGERNAPGGDIWTRRMPPPQW